MGESWQFTQQGGGAGGGEVSPGSGSTGFTVGRVVFANSSGQITNAAGAPYFDSTLNRLGIGVASTAPGAAFAVRAPTTGEIAMRLVAASTAQAAALLNVAGGPALTNQMGFSSVAQLRWLDSTLQTTVAPSSGAGAAPPANPGSYVRIQLPDGSGGWIPVYATNASAL